MNTSLSAAASMGRVTTALAKPITPRISAEAKGMPAICWINTTGRPRSFAMASARMLVT